MFGYNRKTRLRDITDGTSNTVMISEASKDYGAWSAGGTATIRSLTKKPYINGPDGIGGPFPGGCHMLMGDGSVRFVSQNIDPKTMEGPHHHPRRRSRERLLRVAKMRAVGVSPRFDS